MVFVEIATFLHQFCFLQVIMCVLFIIIHQLIYHYLILLEIYGTPIAASPLNQIPVINWSNYSSLLTTQSLNVNPPTRATAGIDRAIDTFTDNINSAIHVRSHEPKKRRNSKTLYPEIQNEVRIKNSLRRVWTQTCNPTIKDRLNIRIKFIKSLKSTH